MAPMLAALGVAGEDIAAGDVWVATGADGQIAGAVALAPGDAPGARGHRAQTARGRAGRRRA
jgi:hypothetical protein